MARMNAGFVHSLFKRRNMMLFANEIPVIAALNPYRSIEDVFRTVWERTEPSQVLKWATAPDMKLENIEKKEERAVRLIQETNMGSLTKATVTAAEKAESITSIQQIASTFRKEIKSNTSIPEDIKEEIVQHTISQVQTNYGTKKEAPAIQAYAKETSQVVKERNAQFHQRSVGTIDGRKICIGGRIDASTDDRVIEVKNRMKRFIDPLPRYDIAQLQTYLFILDRENGEVVEAMHTPEIVSKSTLVPRDRAFWENTILPHITPFSHALCTFMEKEDLQKQFMEKPEHRLEIIRSLWMKAPHTM